jgi:hypothetical protein
MNEQVKIALLRRPPARDQHLRACVDALGDACELADADVLYFARPIAAPDVAAQLAAYPGCVVCAGTADDGTVLLAVRGDVAALSGPCSELASILHALVVWGFEITAA